MLLQQIASIVSLVLGMLLIAEGMRTLSNKSRDGEYDGADKKLLSPHTRHWIRRYYNGFDLVKAGFGFIALAALLHFAQL